MDGIEYLPKKTDFNTIDNKFINLIIKKLNNRPRKLLNFKTPNEVFLIILTKQMLHLLLKCSNALR